MNSSTRFREDHLEQRETVLSGSGHYNTQAQTSTLILTWRRRALSTYSKQPIFETRRPFMAITFPFATGHVAQEGKARIIRPVFNNVAMWPAGSIFSNAKDLSRWVVALMNEGRVRAGQ